jgi:GDPmannose 4,6-dehydratase
MTVAFITGITGQDGSYLAEQLTAEGVEVHGMVRAADPLQADLEARCPDVHLHEADLTEPAELAGLVAEIAPDEIYHLAGISSVALSWDEPVLTAQTTGVGAAALLDAAWTLQEQSGRPVRYVQATSAEIFGQPSRSPQNESTPIRPNSPYGAAKAFAHLQGIVFRGRGLHVANCILYNHESPRRPLQFVTRKITHAAVQIAQGHESMLSLGNLDARRDWGWAPDYVAAMVLAARHPTADDYVIATGESHTVEDFVVAAFAHVGITDWRPLVEVDPRFVRPVDATEQRGDAAHARRALGWAPTIGFAQIVERMVDHDLTVSA